MMNRDLKGLILLLTLFGLTLSLMIFISLLRNPFEFNAEDDVQDDIIPQHYHLEFIDHLDYMICHSTIFFQLTQDRYRFSIVKTIDHFIEISSIILQQKQYSISIEIEIKPNQIIIKKRQWFHSGNYSISFLTHINISNTIKSSFIRQSWPSDYRILFTNNYPFPFLPHSSYRSTFNLNIISTDTIISNLLPNQTRKSFDPSQIGFALLNQYECRSIDILQLCFPFSQFDFFSYLFNYTLTTIKLFESYFSRSFPFDKLTLITTLELHTPILWKSGLVFLDQNSFLTNTSAEQILQQHQLIFLIVAHQWIDGLIQFDRERKWLGKSLARTIANHLFHQTNELIGNDNIQIERFMSTVLIDSLCHTDRSNDIKSENISLEKAETFLTEYRIYLGDNQFHSLIKQSIEYSNTTILLSNWSSFLSWSTLPGHPVVFFNSSSIEMYLFKFNSNCSKSISPIHSITYRLLSNSSSINRLQTSSNFSENSIALNPFVQLFPSSWNHLIDELKTFRSQQSNFISRILFDSFLFNLANQLSIEYPLQLVHLFFQQSFSTFIKNDLIILHKILKWYRSILPNSLNDKFVIYLRKLLHPFCTNQLWTKPILIDSKSYNQQIINEILLELCCSINHSICLQPISNKNDPQILLQYLFNHQRFDSTKVKPSVHRNQTNMLTSFNQLRIPSPFIYSDRIILNIICQIVRQQNEKYWYKLIQFIQQNFQLIPSAILTGLSCAIRTREQLDYYLTNLCPPSPFKWPCYRNLLIYSSMKTFDQLETIDHEQWPTNTDELVDFFFHFSTIPGNFSSHPMLAEFQSLIFTWLTANQDEFLHWFDNQNAYLI